MNPLASIPSAFAKLTAMADATDEANSLVHATARRISDLNAALGTASTEGAANIEFELSRLRARMSVQQDTFRARSFIDTAVRNWLQTLPPDAALEAAKPVKVKLDKGTTRAAAINAIREKVLALIAERQQVQRASPLIADTKAMATAYVERLQARGAPRIIATETSFEIAFDANLPNSNVPKADLPAILAFLNAPLLIERLHDAIDKQPAPSRRMSAADKVARLNQIATELFVLGREEEALIEASETEGPVIARRPDADPAAILGLRIKQRESAAA